MLLRPQSNEYNPYFEKYINLVPQGNLVEILQKQQIETQKLLEHVSEAQGDFRYDVGKWTLKEVVGHIADTERVMSYRLLAIARGDTASLPSFDENLYVEGAEFTRLNLKDVLADFSAVRQSTISLLTSLSDTAVTRVGTVYNHPTTVRGLGYIIAGHEIHHRAIIKERYLSSN